MLVAIGVGLLSLILIYLEFFVPGAVLGILGGVGFCISILLFIWESGNAWLIATFIVFIMALLILTIKLALWKIKQKPAMFAKEEQSGYLASQYDKEMIGKEGEAATDLKPSGHIRIEGERYQAVSESRYIKKGESVKVVGGEGARLIVRKH
ncbi:MAG: serine protease [Simkaniaceae bacterium]|nr:MAG: serine protease [Simkaniaceae bacterium]